MLEITEDIMYKFFLTLSLVSAIVTVISMSSGNVIFNMNPEKFAAFVGDAFSDVMNGLMKW